MVKIPQKYYTCTFNQLSAACSWLTLITTQCSAEAQTLAFNQAPSDLVKNLQDHAEVSNVPEIGCKGNYMFTAEQLNQAPAVVREARESRTVIHILYIF